MSHNDGPVHEDLGTAEGLARFAAAAEDAAREQREREAAEKLDALRRDLASALPVETWKALGGDPLGAEADGSSTVRLEGAFALGGTTWRWRASAYGGQQGYVHFEFPLGKKARLQVPGRWSSYRQSEGDVLGANTREVGGILADLPVLKRESDDRENRRREDRLQREHGEFLRVLEGGFRSNPKGLREYAARAETFANGELEEGSERALALARAVAEARGRASREEDAADERQAREDGVRAALERLALEHERDLAAHDEACRSFAEARASQHFRPWKATKVRYCPDFPAQAPMVRYREDDDEGSGSFLADAVRDALVHEAVGLPRRPSTKDEPGTFLYEEVRHDGSTGTLYVGGVLDARERAFAEHDPESPMPYHRKVKVGPYWINLPPTTPDLVDAGIEADVPDPPASFRQRVRDEIAAEDLALLDREAQDAITGGCHHLFLPRKAPEDREDPQTDDDFLPF